MYPVLGVAVDDIDGVAQPIVGVDAIEFCRSEQGVDEGCVACGIVAYGKHLVRAAHGDGADGAFHEVVVDFQPPVGANAHDVFESALEVFDGRGDGGLWRDPRQPSAAKCHSRC